MARVNKVGPEGMSWGEELEAHSQGEAELVVVFQIPLSPASYHHLLHFG